ncbi:MAG: hypothetical protein L0Z70_04430 [Chloroflexi bacterium]|nr:hypothetical protein [Chloroflexota bacterium]
MKVIATPVQGSKSGSASRLDEVMGSLRLGRSWSQDMEAQEGVIAPLEKALDNRFVMLRNVILEGLDVPIPLVLVGPPGVRVLYPSAQRGVFRARGEAWEQMDDRSQVYRPLTPNLLTRAQLMARAVDAFLSTRGIKAGETEPVLLLMDSGSHVDSARPIVRIVLADGLERFIAGLLQARILLDKDETQKIVDTFSKSMGVVEEAAFPERDVFSFTDEASAKPSLGDRLPRGEKVAKSLNKLPFSGRQWVLLGLLALINILVLVGFVILIFLTN